MGKISQLARGVSPARALDFFVSRRTMVAFAVFVAVYVIGSAFDLSESFTEWAERHEDWELDEFPASVLGAALAFGLLAFLENQRGRRELGRRREAERQLSEAMLAAVSADESKTNFLASFSHELRTPLNAIMGFCEMIRSATFGEITPVRYREYVEDIHVSSQHLLTLIDRILDITSMEAGRYRLSREQVRVGDFADDVVSSLGERAASKGLTIISAVPADLVVFADGRALRRIIDNLVRNAVQFTNSDGQITVSGHLDADGELVLSVADTGVGVEPAALATIFEPMARPSPHRSTLGEGAGLGLTVVKHLVELHGGSIAFASQFGQGTKVTISLPQRRLPRGEPPEAGLAVGAP